MLVAMALMPHAEGARKPGPDSRARPHRQQRERPVRQEALPGARARHLRPHRGHQPALPVGPAECSQLCGVRAVHTSVAELLDNCPYGVTALWRPARRGLQPST